MGTVRALSIARWMSPISIVRSPPATATIPLLLTALMWAPPMLTWAEPILRPLLRSAFATQARIASVASSRSTMVPFLMPCDGTVPTLVTWTFGWPARSPTRVQTLELPTSMMATIRSFVIDPPSHPAFDEQAPDDRQVIEDSHPEGHDRRDIELDAEPVGEVGQERREDRVDEEAADEDPVVEAVVDVGA